MLERLALHNVGPARSMTLEYAPRANLITGDNGLGKSFLLDLSWWALTRRWPREVNFGMTSGYPARPRDPSGPASIRVEVQGRTAPVSFEVRYSRTDQEWSVRPGRPPMPGVVVYAHADGSFSVWDPARNYWNDPGRRPAYVFTEAEVWDGLSDAVNGRTTPICNGLVSDWSSWIRAADDNADAMASVLAALSPSGAPNEAIRPGRPVRLSLDDARDIPCIETGHAGAVPILHASSGVRRVVALAYMLTWTWREHRIAAGLRGEDPASQIVMLFDEVESHLHPRWQRSILPALRNVGSTLPGSGQLQLVVSTHSPLVLASAEPWFDPERDAWFDLDLEGEPPEPLLRRRSFTARGTTGGWLTSEAFDLQTDRSLEAESAYLRAMALLTQEDPTLSDVMDVHEELVSTFPDVDRFWVRWNAFVEERGGEP